MMERWLVIGTDARMKQLAKRLMNENRTVYYKCTSKWTTELNHVLLDYFPEKIILPIQPLQIHVEQLQGIQQAKFFAGKLTEEWQQLLPMQPAYYLQDETFIWRNAALTAEAMLAHLYKGNIAVQNKKVLITGFGRVAKMLANLLARLHVHVNIAVRSEVQLAEALAHGYCASFLDEHINVEADYCINTIPAKWLDATYKALISMPVYDLASEPGCLGDVTLADYEFLPALPGKYFPREAAELLYTTILQLDGG